MCECVHITYFSRYCLQITVIFTENYNINTNIYIECIYIICAEEYTYYLDACGTIEVVRRIFQCKEIYVKVNIQNCKIVYIFLRNGNDISLITW